jgi:hypothetical protein
MWDDEATRSRPDRPPARSRFRLRRWRWGGRDPAAPDDDHARDGRGCAEACGSHGSQRQPPPLHLRALEQPHSRLGRELDARPGTRSAAGSGGGSTKAGDSSAVDLRPIPGHLDQPRSVICASDSDGARTPARPATRQREAWGADGRAHRDRAHRASAPRHLESFRRLESRDSRLSRVLGSLLAIVAALVFVAHAAADTRKPPPPPTVTLGYFSQQVNRSQAKIGGSIDLKRSAPGRERQASSRSTSRVARTPPKGGAGDNLPDSYTYPRLRADSNFARNPEPFGPGSWWYTDSSGRVCIYAPSSVLPCYTLAGPGTPGADPGAIAASVADRLPLLPGRIRPSPQTAGLTGAVSWFWLDPAPSVEELTVTLAGETVSVRAEPSVIEWRFGDGARLRGGPGLPYRLGPPPEGAVVHVYETRCLPGDQGRNPYVLASCDPSGYGLEAVVVWRISYVASGPIDSSGALPTRTTAAGTPYPVTESRGFLVPGASS